LLKTPEANIQSSRYVDFLNATEWLCKREKGDKGLADFLTVSDLMYLSWTLLALFIDNFEIEKFNCAKVYCLCLVTLLSSMAACLDPTIWTVRQGLLMMEEI
jgi:hypothetical protein